MLTVTKIKLFDDSWTALADIEIGVVLADGTQGKIAVNGLRVNQGKNGKGPWVSFPARKGQKTDKWFDVVTVNGPLKKVICDAVLLKYVEADQQRSGQQKR